MISSFCVWTAALGSVGHVVGDTGLDLREAARVGETNLVVMRRMDGTGNHRSR